jgi:hypothetical protein
MDPFCAFSLSEPASRLASEPHSMPTGEGQDRTVKGTFASISP